MANFRDLIKQNGGGVYSPSNKPSPSDIGAYSKDEVNDKFISSGRNQISNPDALIRSGKNSFNALSNSYEGLEGDRALITAVMGSGGIQIAGRTVGNEIHVRAASSNGEGEIGEWHRIYTTGYKPNANDVGAYSKSESDNKYLTKTAKAADADKLDGLDSGSFVRSNADDTLAAKLVTNGSDRTHGIYGTYDSNKISHVWSMGTSYKLDPTGANFGNLYGLAYKHTNNPTGGNMAGGHQIVWVTNGVPQVSLGDGGVWTNGYVQADAYVNSNESLRFNHKTVVGGANDTWLRLNPNNDFTSGVVITGKVVTTAAQSADANALTRKDYVDYGLASKLNTSGGTVSGNLTINGNLNVGSSKFLMEGVNMMGASDSVARFGDGTYARPMNLNAKDGVINVVSAAGATAQRVFHEGYKPKLSDIKTLELDLEGLDATKFYAVVLEPTGDNSVGALFHVDISTKSTGGNDPYNNNTVTGFVRGGGWSDLHAMYELTCVKYVDNETTIHSVWEGSENFTGIVFYVRGNQQARIRTNGNVKAIRSGTYTSGNSVFATGVSDPNSAVTKGSKLVQFDKGGYYKNTMPNRSGVLSQSMTIEGAVDFNNYTLTGSYNVYNVTSATNRPPAADFGTLDVIGRENISRSFVTQIFTRKVDGSQYIRTRNDGGFAWTPWKKIYSEALKPTAAELGVAVCLPSSQAVDLNTYDTISKSGFYSISANTSNWPFGGSGGSLIVSAHGNGSYVTQLAFAATSNLTKIRTHTGGAWSPWYTFYTSENKPTASEVGALSKTSDDTTTYQLTFQGSPLSTGDKAHIFHDGRVASGQTLVTRSMRENTSATWVWEKVAGGQIQYSTGKNASGATRIVMNVGVGDLGTSNQVYSPKINATGTGSGQGIAFNGKTVIGGTNDTWLRLNPHNSFSGIYCANSLLRTDNQIQVGSWSAGNKVAKVQGSHYDSSWGNNGIAAYSVNNPDSNGAHWAFASYYDATNIRSGIQILSDVSGRMRFYTNRRSRYVEVNNGEVYAQGTRIAKTYSGTAAPTTQGIDGDVYIQY
ncbi:hypothetical protein ACOIYK_001888 [Vibrio parahaemolyticus]